MTGGLVKSTATTYTRHFSLLDLKSNISGILSISALPLRNTCYDLKVGIGDEDRRSAFSRSEMYYSIAHVIKSYQLLTSILVLMINEV